MAACPDAQRELNRARVDNLTAEFDPDLIGHIVVNVRDADHVAIIDGQHRVEALKAYLGEGWQKQQVACLAYEGLTIAQEAELFLRYNNTLNVTTYAKFTVGVTAGRADECDVKRIVEKQGLHVARNRRERAVACVGALMQVYKQHGPDALARSLRIARDAFGDSGFESRIIYGLGMVCRRYGARFDEETAKRKLGKLKGGAGGLLGKSRQTRSAFACSYADAMAASIVEVVTGRGGMRLNSWWESADEVDTPTTRVITAPRAAASAHA